MSVIIRTIDEIINATEFTPFDESKKTEFSVASQRVEYNSSSLKNVGINTSEIDQFRQGIEITTHAHRFKGTGPKIWAGNIKGYTNVQTIGDKRSFTDYEKTKIFEETLEYNPVTYINSTEEVYFSDVINDIPVDNLEANIQPITIRSRNGINELNDPYYIRNIRGNLEDGNQKYDTLFGFNNKIEQYQYFNNEIITPFDDLNTVSKIYIINEISYSYKTNEINKQINRNVVFNELNQYYLIEQLNTTDNNLISLLKSGSNINLNEDIRDTYNKKSSTAGYSVYGPNTAQLGTDSITFIGWLKGT